MDILKTLVLTLNTHPFSLNSSHYRNGNRTSEYRDWTENIHNMLDSHREEIEEFTSFFNEKKHALIFKCVHFIPSSILYTKTGKISRRSKDLSNVEKTLVDSLFEPRYFKRGFSTLNLDDTLIIDLYSFKRVSPHDTFCIQVIIQIVPLSKSCACPPEFSSDEN